MKLRLCGRDRVKLAGHWEALQEFPSSDVQDAIIGCIAAVDANIYFVLKNKDPAENSDSDGDRGSPLLMRDADVALDAELLSERYRGALERLSMTDVEDLKIILAVTHRMIKKV